MVLGKASQTLDVAGGKEKTLEGEWAARIIVVVGQKDGDVKIKMHQVWAVCFVFPFHLLFQIFGIV